jgi:hypothetical protein
MSLFERDAAGAAPFKIDLRIRIKPRAPERIEDFDSV